MAQIHIRVDDDVKRMAEEACDEMGITLSAAVNIFLIKLGREKRILFELTDDPFYSEENMQRLRKSVAQLNATGGTIHDVDIEN
ncbi:MAG: type II toxin-antitoxin system RelB/DinJ family antitoxin [Clostridia bacterium]|nr:type II toxin-antitoxin system RelB/DinJ family antitoxin [Clostridia bacterium]